MMKNKKSQIFTLSAMFLFILLLFSYSIETRNSYKPYLDKFDILDNIVYETCQVGKNSNGSLIDSRFSSYTSSVTEYCNGYSYTCSLNIVKQGGAPTNLSELNYTHYDYDISYSNEGFNYSKSFVC